MGGCHSLLLEECALQSSKQVRKRLMFLINPWMIAEGRCHSSMWLQLHPLGPLSVSASEVLPARGLNLVLETGLVAGCS